MPEGEIGGPYVSLHDDKVAKQKVIDFITKQKESKYVKNKIIHYFHFDMKKKNQSKTLL